MNGFTSRWPRFTQILLCQLFQFVKIEEPVHPTTKVTLWFIIIAVVRLKEAEGLNMAFSYL